MVEEAENIIKNSGIFVSRNTPIVFIVGAAGFLGSYLAEEFLKKEVQVIGLDDFSTGKRVNVERLIKNKNFHLVEQSICQNPPTSENFLRMELPRLDYAYFLADSDSEDVFGIGVLNFLEFVKKQRDLHLREKGGKARFSEKPRICFVSTVNLYEREVSGVALEIKQAEVRLARYVKENGLNARIVRLSPVYGPRMHFRDDEPMVRLIQAALQNEIQNEQTALDFSSRAIFVCDAVDLLIKSTLLGGTAQKIYDGALYEPIKVSDIRQILLDPLWHEQTNFNPAPLPPWPTPNLKKTVKELSWGPKVGVVKALKKTIVYFKDSGVKVPRIEKEELERDFRRWSFKMVEGGENLQKSESLSSLVRAAEESRFLRFNPFTAIKERISLYLAVAIICYALLFPLFSLIFGALTIRENIKSSAEFLEKGEFDRALVQVERAESTVKQIRGLIGSTEVFRKVRVFDRAVNSVDSLLNLTDDGVWAVKHVTLGTKALFQTTKVISGEENRDPSKDYEEALRELKAAEERLTRVEVKLAEGGLLEALPGFLKQRVDDLNQKLKFYKNLTAKARTAAILMPEITAVNGVKTYLILLQNNLELRPGGGFIGSYARITFEKGKVRDILVDDIYNLDGKLKERIDPPDELEADLGQKFWYLRDSNLEPDFPTSARAAEFFYLKEAGERVNGVAAIDLTASGRLLSAVGGVDISEYNERVDGGNLFEKAIQHAEVGFFPGSQAKKNYLTTLQGQLFNKVFFLQKHNWPAIISALGQSLEEKHIMVYLKDPELFSYLVSENWSGVMPREARPSEGVFNDFVAVIESNMGANKVNFYIERDFELETKLSNEGEIAHRLKINYLNTSPSDNFPAGSYRNRLKLYLPSGSKLERALWGESEITSQFKPFSDYGRAGFSALLELNPKEQKSLVVEYKISKLLIIKEGEIRYRLDLFKQAGTDSDRFGWVFEYPKEVKVESQSKGGITQNQEVNIMSDLRVDRSFEAVLSR